MFFIKKPIPTVELIEGDGLLIIYCFIKRKKVAYMNCVLEDKKTILIGDINHTNKSYINLGYGSLMMKSLIEYAKIKQYSLIRGNLSTVDIDHKERLFHFYKKFGFVVTIFDKIDNSYFGVIEKDID